MYVMRDVFTAVSVNDYGRWECDTVSPLSRFVSVDFGMSRTRPLCWPITDSEQKEIIWFLMFVCCASWLYDNVILEMMGWIVLYVLGQF
jgi:hypothetical protein